MIEAQTILATERLFVQAQIAADAAASVCLRRRSKTQAERRCMSSKDRNEMKTPQQLVPRQLLIKYRQYSKKSLSLFAPPSPALHQLLPCHHLSSCPTPTCLPELVRPLLSMHFALIRSERRQTVLCEPGGGAQCGAMG